MSLTAAGAAPAANRGGKDIAFAVGIVLILCLFFLPVPAFMIDFGLALSIALAVLILMVALWIHKPLEFSAFPTVLLVATILRLALNISTTRLILSRGEQGPTSAGYIIGGFARLVMGGDFVIGIIVFLILVTINFLVITKGATRIAEVGARFTLDAIPGKQMAIDADLSAGLIDEKVAQARRRELEEESAFFGSMDGASKFVRGDAIAGIIILAVNIFGGIVIGVTRHGLSLSAAADIFTKLSVGDGLVTQIPALIISLAAGLLVAKGGTRGSADKAVIDQLSGYPERALSRRHDDGGARRRSRPAVAALRADRRADGFRRRRHSAADREGPRRRGGEGGGKGRAGEGRRARLDQGAAQVVRDRACLEQGAQRRASRLARRDRLPHRQDAAQVRPPIWLRRSRDPAHRRHQGAAEDLPDQDSRRRRRHPGAQGQGLPRHHRRWAPPQSPWRRSPRARFRHAGDRDSRSLRQGRQAPGFQAGRSGLGPADPLERGHPQQSRPAPVVQGHARAARPARARVQAAARRHVSLADLAIRAAGDAEAPARRARLDPQSEPDPGSGG